MKNALVHLKNKEKKDVSVGMMSKDKYKDPVNDAILKEISKKVEQFKKDVLNDTDDKGLNLTKELFNFVKDMELKCYRIGCYAGMNVALKNLGRETL